MMRRTSNPTLNDRIFDNVGVAPGTEVMTIEGTVNKTFLALLITAGVGWFTASDPTMMGFAIPAWIIGIILGFVIAFKPKLAPVLTPVYAACQGCLLGWISLMYAQMHPESGIVTQAVALTFATLFVMLFAYKSGLIKATPAFKKGIIMATGAIMVFYLVSIVLMLFGMKLDIFYGNGPISIVFSLIVVGIAALNLVLDFDFIENAAASKSAPKFMEWYGAFALLVTLVWLYLEILRLLSKLQSRD